jgi:hypothetical protein
MSAIIGFTDNGGEDWFVSAQYGTKEIQAIPDPEGGHALNAPTSIPSPFARMDLVRKSFENIGQSPRLGFYQRGETVVASREDERAVSQCLDLAELLFFYENFKDRIEIIEWNKQHQVKTLIDSPNPGHRKLGDVLDMYLRQDAGSFNFHALNSIYIIKCNHQVIGGTSPLTLFFNAANRSGSLNLISTKGKAFFSDVVPLYERDPEFQKYIYLLFKASPDLGEKMKAFQEYLNKNLNILSTSAPALFNALNTLKTSLIWRAIIKVFTPKTPDRWWKCLMSHSKFLIRIRYQWIRATLLSIVPNIMGLSPWCCRTVLTNPLNMLTEAGTSVPW